MVTQILQNHSLQLAQSLLFLRVFGLALLRKGEPPGHMVQGKHQESAIFLEKENIDQSKLSSCPHRSGEHFLFRHCKTETRSFSFTRKQIRQGIRLYGGFRIEAAASSMSIFYWNFQGTGSRETVRQLRVFRSKFSRILCS